MKTVSPKFKKLHPDAKFPVMATEQAGAYDVFCTEIIKESDDCYVAKLGFALEFNPNFKLMFGPRSSITKTKWNIQNSPGIGDADFRGEYSLRFRAFPDGTIHKELYIEDEELSRKEIHYFLSYPTFPYRAGDRVAQCYFQEKIVANWTESEELSETFRGIGAYGSTGK